MEIEKPENFCDKCNSLVDMSGTLSIRQVMFYHETDCDPVAKKRKAAKKLQPVEPEVLNPLTTDDDYIREVNEVCGKEVNLKSWQLSAVKRITDKYSIGGLQSFVLADEMGLGRFYFTVP